jgi:predicted DNA-binding WGR domain protein
MRRFELSEGTANKFWQFELEGSELLISWGKIGTSGQSQTKSFATPKAALAAAEKLVAEKTKKGYAEVASSEVDAPPPKPKAPSKAKPAPEAPQPEAKADSKAKAAPEAAAPVEPESSGSKPSSGLGLEERLSPNPEESPAEPPKLLSAAECLKAVAKHAGEISWAKYTRKGDLESGLTHAQGSYREYAERILKTYAVGKAPPSLDPDGDAALVHFGDQEHALGYLCVRGGLPYLVKVLVRAAYVQHVSVGGQGGSYRYFEPAQPDLKGYCHSITIAQFIRSLRGVSGMDFVAAHAEAEKWRGEPLSVRIALAYALHDKAWMADDTRAILALKKNDYYYGLPRILFEGLGDLEIVLALATRHPSDVDVDGVLDRFGIAAQKAAIASFDPKSDWSAQKLVRIESLAVAKAFVEALPHKKPAETVKEYYGRRPDLAILALAPVVARGDKSATYAKPVLDAIVRKHPKLPEKLAAHLEPKSLALFGKAAAVVRLPEASLSSLPAELSAPPPPPKRGKAPKMPEFLDLSTLPQVLLAGGKQALPVAAVGTLVAILQRSTLAEPHEAFPAAKKACAAASLSAFAWAIFEAWLASGTGSKENWAFTALGLVGDDEAARRLTPLIRSWPGESQHARAGVGLDVLAGIGTDLALMNLHGIAEKVKFKALQEKAKEKIGAIAAARGLTSEELADRLVPDLGLGEDGGLVLSFGSRTFKVAFDETLKPIVRDAGGKVLPDLPKPTKNDDATKAAEATERWKTLKKDARAIASSQILRLELAMCGQRRWKAGDFESFILRHPLVVHLARRLVWGIFDGGKLTGSFRVAEDGTLADMSDKTLALPSEATIGLLHRLEMPDGLVEKWGSTLAEYEILQPFDQLGRQIYPPTDEEKKANVLWRMKGAEVKTGKVMGLEVRGWRKGAAQDAGWVWDMWKPLPGDFEVTFGIEGGLCMGAPDMNPPTQKLDGVGIAKVAGGKATFGQLTPTAFSELVRELGSLRD